MDTYTNNFKTWKADMPEEMHNPGTAYIKKKDTTYVTEWHGDSLKVFKLFPQGVTVQDSKKNPQKAVWTSDMPNEQHKPEVVRKLKKVLKNKQSKARKTKVPERKA